MFSENAIQAIIARNEAAIGGLFDAQRAAATDVARFKAIRTPRRAGKSTCILSRFLELGLKHPKSRFPYIMLTRGQCKDVAWSTLKELDYAYNIGCKFNETELYATLPGESIISMYGADKPGWMSRMRGQRNRAAAIDEAQDFTVDLQQMIYQVIRPTLLDQQGELFLAGTPGNIKAGVFYHVTQQTGKIPGWKVFTWSTKDNPYVSAQYLSELEQIRAEHPDIDIMTLPWVQRELFGMWSEDEVDNVYSFNPDLNSTYKWERQEGDEFVCGIDLGWHDRTAFVVICWSETRPDVTVVEAFRFPKMKLDDAARQVKDFEEQYPGVIFVADPARRQLLEELQIRADVYLEAAEKAEKKDYIELCNRDLQRGDIKILNPEHSVLAKELTDLKWITRPSGKVEEHPALPNDCCDAFLYAWRRALHFRWKEPVIPPKPGTMHYYEAEAQRLKELAIARNRAVSVANERRAWWERG